MHTGVVHRVTRSCIATVSQSAGITAPVKMRTHSPCRPGRVGLAGIAGADALHDRLYHRLAPMSACRYAQPSIAELSWPGTSIGEMMSLATTPQRRANVQTLGDRDRGQKLADERPLALSTGMELGS